MLDELLRDLLAIALVLGLAEVSIDGRVMRGRTPSPSSKRIVSSFEVGSTRRASMTCSNTASSRGPNPRRAYAVRRVDQNTSLEVPAT